MSDCTPDRNPDNAPGSSPILPDDLALGLEVAGAWAALTPDRKRLAEENIGLVGVHIRNHVPTPVQPTRHREHDDLFQEGCVALVRAAARYNPGTDGPFAAYAFPRIRGAIFAAIHERFTTIRIPTRETLKAKASPGLFPHPVEQPLEDLIEPPSIAPPADPLRCDEDESIRHAIRRRYERVVRQALESLRKRRWRRRNPCDIMQRIAAERLLISQEHQRTPLRQIARDAGVSSGRISAYEQQLRDAVNEQLAHDTRLPLLLRFARENPDGLNGTLDDEQRQLIAQAELKAFDERFVRLDRTTRAKLVYHMIEQSAHTVDEVAHNLYRLTFRNTDDRPDTVRQTA